MDSIRIERLDHHGIVAGIIDELKIVKIINGQIEADSQEEVSTSDAVLRPRLTDQAFPADLWS